MKRFYVYSGTELVGESGTFAVRFLNKKSDDGEMPAAATVVVFIYRDHNLNVLW